MLVSLIGVRSVLAVIVLLTTSEIGTNALEQGQSCINPAGQSGKCILFRECQPLVTIYSKPVPTSDDTNFLMQSRCGTFKHKTLVCCVEQEEEHLLPEPPHCGFQLSDRIVGGNETTLDEFPWMALIEYRKSNDDIGFHCGGSLISERYVLTAAHCVTSLPQGWKLLRVRLGEWDLGTPEDCQDGLCADPPLEMNIDRTIVHARYDTRDMSKANDIALIRLKNPVNYSETVRPICLPASDEIRSRDVVGLPSFAAGWGKTATESSSQKKLKVMLRIKALHECSRIYQNSGILLKPTHLCVGGERGKDTCIGDSGGPLMRQLTGVWYLLGVVSFGAEKCGTIGVPGIYVKVAEYVDWIRENMIDV